MADVVFQIADYEWRREENGIVFWAKSSNGEQIGSLVVSKGGLRWYEGKSSKRHRFLSWGEFAREIKKIRDLTS